MELLPWTPPYDWAWMVGFLQARAVAGVERFDEGGYSRSFGVEGHRGLIHLAPDEEAQGLRVTLSPGLQPVAESCYARIGQLFDLACDPRQVAGALGSLAQARPGLRLPGALDAFEQAVRAVLGQLVSVAMAARLTAKVAAGWGEPLAEAPGYVLFPTPEALSRADPQAKDIFLPDDYLIKQRFPGMTPAAIARYARRWQPMRSYALLHIWYTDDWIPAAE